MHVYTPIFEGKYIDNTILRPTNRPETSFSLCLSARRGPDPPEEPREVPERHRRPVALHARVAPTAGRRVAKALGAQRARARVEDLGLREPRQGHHLGYIGCYSLYYSRLLWLLYKAIMAMSWCFPWLLVVELTSLEPFPEVRERKQLVESHIAAVDAKRGPLCAFKFL